MMKRRSKRGTGIIESLCAAIVLIMVAVTLLDFIVLVMANQMNDAAAKNACRAAANQADETTASKAASDALATFQKSTLVTSLSLNGPEWPTDDTVQVETTMVVHLPMPFPGWDTMTFKAKDVEPVVDFSVK